MLSKKMNYKYGKVVFLFFILLFVSGCQANKANNWNENNEVYSTNTNNVVKITETIFNDSKNDNSFDDTSILAVGNIGWIRSKNISVETIKEYWRIGYNISNVNYNREYWDIIISKDGNLFDQEILVNSNFPEQTILGARINGEYITDIDYENYQWVIVLSRNDLYEAQKIIKIEDIKDLDANVYHDEGFWISNIVFCKDSWYIVITKSDQEPKQKILVSEIFPTELINDASEEKYYFVQQECGENIWVVILSESSYTDQIIKDWPIGPKDLFIDVAYKLDYQYVTMFWGDEKWFVIGKK